GGLAAGRPGRRKPVGPGGAEKTARTPRVTLARTEGTGIKNGGARLLTERAPAVIDRRSGGSRRFSAGLEPLAEHFLGVGARDHRHFGELARQAKQGFGL